MLNVLTQNSYGLGRRLILLAALLVVLAAGTLVPASDRTLPLAGLALAALIALVGTRQDRTAARRLQTPTLNQQPTFCDDIFAQVGNWVTMHHADGNTLCETLLETHGDADQALALLRGPWTWWGRGHAREYSELRGNNTGQILVPGSWYWCHVRMQLLSPVRLAENVWRIPGVLAGSFDGPATFDVISPPAPIASPFVGASTMCRTTSPSSPNTSSPAPTSAPKPAFSRSPSPRAPAGSVSATFSKPAFPNLKPPPSS
jgi:hypothetical protein